MRILFILLLLGIYACSGDYTKTLPGSSGRIDEIVLVSSKKQWEGTVGKSLKSFLRAPFPALPKDEPSFDVIQVTPAGFVHLLQQTATIVLICGGSSSSANKFFPPEVEIKNQRLSTYKNVWASPQNVVLIQGNSDEEINEFILANTEQIVQHVKSMESAKARRNVFASGIHKENTALLKKNMNVELNIPVTYRQAVNNENQAWFRQDIENAVENLMIQIVPLDTIPFDTLLPILGRNMVGQLVETQIENSHMETELRVDPDYKELDFHGHRAIETRGLWNMTNEYMGGSFINLCIEDKPRNRAIVIDGWVYAPQFDKRKFIRKLEMFMYSLKVVE